MVQINQQIRHESGIPLGGIGTGTLEIRPDGLFHEWQIFNKGQWSPGSPCCGGDVKPLPGPETLVFLARTRTQDGTVTTRYLALHEHLQELYSFPWIKCVERIRFDGRFPEARLIFEDDALPVTIQAQIFAPFIPNDSRASGTPGFYVHFTVENITDAPVEVSIMGRMANVIGHGQENRTARNSLEQWEEITAVRLGADGLEKNDCTTGDIAFSVTGGETSYVVSAYRNQWGFRSWNSRYGMKVYSYLYSFRDDGRLPDLDGGTIPSLSANFDAAQLSPDERKAVLKELLRYSYPYEMFSRVSRTYPDLAENEEELVEFLNDVARMINELGRHESGETALCSRFLLDPGAERSSLFTVSWFLPNHISQTGSNLGHMYANWFDGAMDICRYLNDNFADLSEQTMTVPEMIYGSSLDEASADAVSGQLSTLTKCTWWTKSGHFGVWEGLGCCGFHTTDITYQGSFPILAFFPDLQKIQMIHGARFQREDGRVHHLFYPDFSAVDEGYERVDMNPQFVMLAARDYLWTGDRDYLDEVWPHVIKAMDSSAALDLDGDGLPDDDTRRNTYDAWDFEGCPSYIASLWLGSLKAGIRLAEEMGDSERASGWRELYDLGTASLESKLWNGEYYMLWKDEATGREDECCMSDQMSGDWFCGIMGWGSICRPDRIRTALESIMRYNFIPDTGLINASYPPGVPERQPTSGNMQAEATWTGIEYTVAALLIQNGMAGDGLAIVRDIHNRYLQAGRFWNHVECGNHYYRALSSWTLLMALSGFRLDVPRKELAFAPVIDSDATAYPFFAPGVSGVYSQQTGLTGSLAQVELITGSLDVGVLEVPELAGIDTPSVIFNTETVDCEVSVSGGMMRIIFSPSISLNAGDVISIG